MAIRDHRIRTLAILLAVGLVALATMLAVTWGRVHRLEGAVADLEQAVGKLQGTWSEDPVPVSPLLLDYQLDLPGRGEVFPAMAANAVPEYWPVAILRVTNAASRPVAQTISAEIPGWSRRSEQSLVIGPRETRQVPVQPELLTRAYRNEEIRHAQLEVRATAINGSLLFVQNRPVLIHGGSEIYWGRRFANAQVSARWVTPHDRVVLELISRARAYMPRGRMAGYNHPTGEPRAIARQVRAQARATFRALQKSGISYVNSLFIMGEYVGQAQRLRLPRETLHLRSANCMDVSIVFASAMENLGMQPLLFIVPGHAFAGVRLGRDSEDILYLDLTVLPKGSFDSAVARAQRWMKKTPDEKLLVVDVAASRVLGVYPLVYEEEVLSGAEATTGRDLAGLVGPGSPRPAPAPDPEARRPPPSPPLHAGEKLAFTAAGSPAPAPRPSPPLGDAWRHPPER